MNPNVTHLEIKFSLKSRTFLVLVQNIHSVGRIKHFEENAVTTDHELFNNIFKFIGIEEPVITKNGNDVINFLKKGNLLFGDKENKTCFISLQSINGTKQIKKIDSQENLPLAIAKNAANIIQNCSFYSPHPTKE